MPTVSSLFIYPIKSCRGISLQTMHFDARGPAQDRRWMLVDEDGVFLTQREHARLGLIAPRFDTAGQLHVSAPDVEPLLVPTEPMERRKVRVWDFEAEAMDLGDAAANWFRNVLRARCRLVKFADDVQRVTNPKYSDPPGEVAFADGYPVLLTTAESLSELNRRLERPIAMNRFRPNVVVRDCQPFEEDTWAELVGPTLSLRVVKPCERCVITTLDPHTQQRGIEPLASLARFRRGAGFEHLPASVRDPKKERAVTFGQNCVHSGSGALRVGDELVSRARATAAV
jgi:uncharacterized protein